MNPASERCSPLDYRAGNMPGDQALSAQSWSGPSSASQRAPIILSSQIGPPLCLTPPPPTPTHQSPNQPVSQPSRLCQASTPPPDLISHRPPPTPSQHPPRNWPYILSWAPLPRYHRTPPPPACRSPPGRGSPAHRRETAPCSWAPAHSWLIIKQHVLGTQFPSFSTTE